MEPGESDPGGERKRTMIMDFKGVSYRVGDKPLLQDITFPLGRGEFVGILGPNGAGKTTLLGLMNALLKPSGGELALFGKSAQTLSRHDILDIRKKVAILLQSPDYNVAIPLTVRELVEIGRTGIRGLFRPLSPVDKDIVDSVLLQLGLKSLAHRTYRTLSGGERQKTQLARALAQEPHLLLLDEPFTGLDMDWQERLAGIIQDIFQKFQIAIVMTTHITGHLPPSCQRAILLSEGRILFDGKTEEALTAEKLEELYHCPVDVIHRSGRIHCFATQREL